MNVVSINMGNYGSTGIIMRSVSQIMNNRGDKAYMLYPGSSLNTKKRDNEYLLCSVFLDKLNQKLAFYTGMNGCFGFVSAFRVLRYIKKFNPDIIHLHNLHNSYINLPILFFYIKKQKIPVVWTFHDCWPITGQCAWAKCEKWMEGCFDCPQLCAYPPSKVDRTQLLWNLKKKWFTGVEKLYIVTPSKWLAGLVDKSFLSGYPVKVINNGIDLSIFRPTYGDFRAKHGISPSQHMLLGVAFGWDERKGLDIFLEMAKRLDPSEYCIVLVGTNEITDELLPENVISIHRTQNQNELAEIYSAADLFVNPTREDNYPTVNMEALACGTPVLTFSTGGSSEIIDDSCGMIVPYNNVNAMLQEIVRICIEKPFSREACLQRSKMFDMNDRYREYLELFYHI